MSFDRDEPECYACGLCERCTSLNTRSAPPGWPEEVERLLAIWENATEGVIAQLMAADAYRALQHLMSMRPAH